MILLYLIIFLYAVSSRVCRHPCVWLYFSNIRTISSSPWLRRPNRFYQPLPLYFSFHNSNQNHD